MDSFYYSTCSLSLSCVGRGRGVMVTTSDRVTADPPGGRGPATVDPAPPPPAVTEQEISKEVSYNILQ